VLGQTRNQILFGGAGEVINTEKVTNLIFILFLPLFLTFLLWTKLELKKFLEHRRKGWECKEKPPNIWSCNVNKVFKAPKRLVNSFMSFLSECIP